MSSLGKSSPGHGRVTIGREALPRRAGIRALLRAAWAAARFWPPLYPQSIFGPMGTWLARHRGGSELAIFDLRRPGQTAWFLLHFGLPSVKRRPPRILERLLPDAATRIFWRPSQVFEQPAPAGSPSSTAGERWFFINGITTHRPLAVLNATLLAKVFGRALTVIHNSTNSFVFDVWESAIGKEFKDDPDLEVRESFTEPCLVATAEILAAVNDPATKRVVVIAHSQGAIIMANVLRAIARALAAEPEGPALRRLEKLEIYTIGNCADTMKYVATAGERPVPWLEHFANERDLVARLGVLSPFQPTPGVIDIDGPVYLRAAGRLPRDGGWGHLLNEHYLFPIADYLEARDGADAAVNPYVGRPGGPAEPRLYGYFAGASPPPLAALGDAARPLNGSVAAQFTARRMGLSR